MVTYSIKRPGSSLRPKRNRKPREKSCGNSCWKRVRYHCVEKREGERCLPLKCRSSCGKRFWWKHESWKSRRRSFGIPSEKSRKV